MVIKTLLALAYIPILGFFSILPWAILFGDSIQLWYENNMLEEYLVVTVLLFAANIYRLTTVTE